MPRKKTTAIATTWGGLPAGSRVFVDTAPFIYVLESHLQFAELFVGLFEAAENGTLSIVLSTVTLAEVLTGGNPNLPAETQRDWKFSANWELPFWENSRFQVDYIRNRSDNVVSAFPQITPEEKTLGWQLLLCAHYQHT